MKNPIVATVNEKSIYLRLVKTMEPYKAIVAVPKEVKAEFERKGIQFFDRDGLYPFVPYKMTKERVGGWLTITIKQDPL